METQKSYKILTHDEYAKVYRTFKRNSQQDDIVRNAVTELILHEFGRNSIDVMSIGSGTGWLEDHLIKHPQLKITSLLAIEPNLCHFEAIKEKSANWKNTIFDLDPSCFGADYGTEKRFDVILMVHTIYYIKNPINAVIKAKSFLKHGGKLIIVAQGEKGGYELTATVYEEVIRNAPPTYAYNCIHGGFIVDGLRKEGIPFTIKEAVDFLNVTDFIGRVESPNYSDTISLFLHTMYEYLDDECKEEIYKKVKKHTTVTEDNRHVFNHYNKFIIVE